MRTINVTPRRRETTYSKYPNQALKLTCTSLVQFIALLFGYHIDKAKKTVSTIFPHSVLYLNITNHPFLKQIVTGNEKWVLYNNVEQKRPRGK